MTVARRTSGSANCGRAEGVNDKTATGVFNRTLALSTAVSIRLWE